MTHQGLITCNMSCTMSFKGTAHLLILTKLKLHLVLVLVHLLYLLLDKVEIAFSFSLSSFAESITWFEAVLAGSLATVSVSCKTCYG